MQILVDADACPASPRGCGLRAPRGACDSVQALRSYRDERTPTAQQFIDEFAGQRRLPSQRLALAIGAAGLAVGTGLYLADRPSDERTARSSAVSPLTPGTVFRDCPTCPLMRVLPAGHFSQGTRDDMYQWPGIAATVRHGEIMRHYYRSFPALNPNGIVPLRPEPGFSAAHHRNLR